MDRALGGRVAARVRDALEALAKGGLTGIRHFVTVVENGGTWLVTLRADGSCGTGREFSLRITCTLTEEQNFHRRFLFRATPLVVTVTRSTDDERRVVEHDIHLDRRSGEFRIDGEAVRAHLDDALESLDLLT